MGRVVGSIRRGVPATASATARCECGHDFGDHIAANEAHNSFCWVCECSGFNEGPAL